MADSTVLGLTAVTVAVTDEVPRVLVVRRMTHDLATPAQRDASDGLDALPFGPFDADRDRTLEQGLRRWVEEQTGLPLRYVEQLYTFGDRFRDPRELAGGARVVTVGYMALVQEAPLSGSGEAEWHDWYDYFPWEDWREGKPDLLTSVIEPALRRWVAAAPDSAAAAKRAERVSTSFAADDLWDTERVLERYELLYSAGLVQEARRDRAIRLAHGLADPGWTDQPDAAASLGTPMAHDNRRILAVTLGRLRGKLKYRPVVFDLLPQQFTLFRLQRTVEALSGVRLHKQNFRRLLLAGGLVEATGALEANTGGRPAELYRFRRDVLRERMVAGVGLPTVRVQD
ncbi:NUDIX hydrolase [Oleisolibacter albus]|uniref:NUDIX hydrolase n=1 Tax=Oleisolibacter albus TaxID=2171757 RepID=UPI000DF32B32|nr:NUDIX domain-containing protein [Oleisolibacter albus]